VDRMVMETEDSHRKVVHRGVPVQSCSSCQNIHPHSRADMCFFRHDNAPAYHSKVCTEYLPSTGLNVLEHPPYSPDLAPRDFVLFPYVKNRLKGRQFSDDHLRVWDDECAQIPEETWRSWFNDWF
jgi:hypothetical protein